MTSLPHNPSADRSREPVRFLVLAAAAHDAAHEEVLYLQPIKVVRSAGGRQLDHAEFAYDLGRTGERLENLRTPAAFAKSIEVRIAGEDGDAVGHPLFWGELTGQTIALGDGESCQVLARIEPYHFGDVLQGPTVWDQLAGESGEAVRLDEDATFNPLIDRIVEPNRSDRLHPQDLYRLWIDPDSARTALAREWHGADGSAEVVVSPWDLPTALDSLCRLLNHSEIFVGCPEQLATEPQLLDPAPPAVTNLTLKRGFYLPRYLDELLDPLGYGWFVGLGFDESFDPPVMARRIRIFRKGTGQHKTVWLQGPSSGIVSTPSQQELLAGEVEWNLADLANVIVGVGALEEREVTVELAAGWPAAEDQYEPDRLRKRTTEDEVDEGQESVYAAHPHAWRLFVGNEDRGLEMGDYPDLTPVFTQAVLRRRPLRDCLTFDAAGKRRAPFLEWLDETEDPDVWKPAPPEWAWKPLDDRIGIEFTGDTPQQEVWNDGAGLRLRITGTITGDKRLTRTVTRRESSPNARDVTLYLDLSDRFHDRLVVQEDFILWGQTFDGPLFASSLAAETHGTDERNDGAALQTYLEKLQDVEDSAAVHVSLRLLGIHVDYELGDLITQIDGRAISLNRNSESSAVKRYPQIVGIEYDYQEQATVLRLETF